MTNLERIRGLGPTDLMIEFERYAKSQARPYVNFRAWLESEDPEYVLRGKSGTLEGEACTVVGQRCMFGMQYAMVLIRRDEVHDFDLRTVPLSEIGEGA